jgi:hypothetical protein
MNSDRDDLRRLLNGWAEPGRVRRLEIRTQARRRARPGRLRRLLRWLGRR